MSHLYAKCKMSGGIVRNHCQVQPRAVFTLDRRELKRAGRC